MHDIMSCLAEVGCYEKAKPLAMIGPTGAGKSTLVGQIIRSPEAVITSDGRRGTNVPIVYSAGTPGQQAQFVIKPEFYGLEELLGKVSQHVGHIQSYLSACSEFEAANSNDPDSTEAVKCRSHQISLQAQHEESLDTLMSILYDSTSPDFSSPQAFQRWLCAEDVTETLNRRVESIWKALEVDYPVQSRQDGNGLFELIEDLSSETQKQSPRAMLSKVWVYIKASESLSNGLTIVDVPGLDDNEERLTEYTSETLRECQAVFLVVSILRYSQVIRQRYFIRQALKAGKPLFLVLSHIDQRDQINLHREKGRLCASDVKAIQDGERVVSQCDKVIVNAERDHISLMDALQRKKTAIMELRETAIGIRSRSAELELSTELKKLFPMDLFKIFFVSATESAKYDDISIPHAEPATMSQEATGVTELRQAMYNLVDQPKCRQLQEVCGQELPMCLDGLIGILSKCKQDSERQTRNQLVGALSSLPIACKASFEKQLHQVHQDYLMLFDNKQSGWAHKMEITGRAWGDTHSATYHAYCRKYGKHRSPYKGVSQTPWDRQIQDIMQAGIESAEVAARKAVDHVRCNVHQAIDDLVRKLELDIIKINGLEDSREFVTAIEKVKPEIGNRLRQWLDGLALKMGDLRLKLVEESEDSFIAEVLRPAYKAANDVKVADFKGALSRAESADMKEKRKTPSKRANRERIRIMQKAFTGIDRNKMPPSERKKDRQFLPGLRELIGGFWQNAITSCIKQLDKALAPLTIKCTDLFDTKFRIIGEVPIDEKLADELMEHAQTARKAFCGPIKAMLEECREVEEGEIVE